MTGPRFTGSRINTWKTRSSSVLDKVSLQSSVRALAMVAKPRIYGKNTGRDLVASFNQLALSPKKDGMNGIESHVTCFNS